LINIPIMIGIGVFAARRFIDADRARGFAEQLLGEYQFWFFSGLALIIAGLVGWGIRQNRKARSESAPE